MKSKLKHKISLKFIHCFGVLFIFGCTYLGRVNNILIWLLSFDVGFFEVIKAVVALLVGAFGSNEQARARKQNSQMEAVTKSDVQPLAIPQIIHENSISCFTSFFVFLNLFGCLQKGILIIKRILRKFVIIHQTHHF